MKNRNLSHSFALKRTSLKKCFAFETVSGEHFYYFISSRIFDIFWWKSNVSDRGGTSEVFLQEPTQQLFMFSRKFANCPDFIEPQVIRFILKFRAPGIW